MPMTATKLADLQAEGQKHIADAKAIAQKAEDKDFSEWTDEMKSGYDDSMAKAKDVLERIKVAKADLAVLDQAKSLADEIGEPAAKEDLDAQGNVPVRDRVKALGLTVVESPEFKAMLKPFLRPDGSVSIPKGTHINSDPIRIKSPIQTKSLFTGGSSTSGGAFVVNERTDIVEMLGRRTLTVRDLVSVRRTQSDTVEFVRQTTHTNAAAVVAEATSSAAPTQNATTGALIKNAGGGYKPEGSWAFEVVSTTVKTIAEWVPATKRSLADVNQLEGLINDELRKDVEEAEEDQVLNGDGAGENITGINNTSGTQTQAWSTDLFETVRKGITKARTVGRVNPSAVVLNPADAERIDLTKDGNDRYYFGGPQAITNRTLWGVPVVESEAQAAGTGLLGDFSKAVIWDREETTVTMTDSHEDFFVRNLVAVLAEERVAFGVTRPSAFVELDLTA
jgi:HK97 family phage major capsid protein